jgi:hypothetical protein
MDVHRVIYRSVEENKKAVFNTRIYEITSLLSPPVRARSRWKEMPTPFGDPKDARRWSTIRDISEASHTRAKSRLE